jgi:hypothetical protein
MKSTINKEGQRSKNATPHNQATQDHRLGAKQDPNKIRTWHKANLKHETSEQSIR